MSKLKILSSKKVFDHPWERIYIERVKGDNNVEFDYLISEPNDFVIIVPFVSKNSVLMLKQYKHGAMRNLLGFPAGYISKKETPIMTAKRELLEETGLKASKLKLIATLSENPTRCRNKYFIVFGWIDDEIKAKHKNKDNSEGKLKQLLIPIPKLKTSKIISQIKGGPMLSALPFIA